MKKRTRLHNFVCRYKSTSAKLRALRKTLSQDDLNKIHAYWRATNYLSVGQLYLCDNPLLREPLKLSHVKSMLLAREITRKYR